MYYSLAGYVDQGVLARVDERNQLVRLDEDTGNEALLASFTPSGEGWWDAPLRTCEQQGQTLERRGVHDGPAGPFPDVLEVRYRTLSCADVGVESEQYAGNIGMVRRVSTTIAGPRQFDLVYARVGKMRIDTLEGGKFTVSVDQNAVPDSLAVTLRLETNASLDLPVHTGEEFDIVVRDEAGNAVFTWSADEFFAEAWHERTLGGEWTTTVAVPRPTAPGNYTVQARFKAHLCGR